MERDERGLSGLKKIGADIFCYGRDLIFPMATYCLCCGKYIDATREYCLCDHCVRHIRWGHIQIDVAKQDVAAGRQRYLDSARACAFYGLYTRRLIFDLKYNGLTYVSRILGKILADRIMSDSHAHVLLEADLTIPIPIHKNKLRQRGFNQAEKMARYMCKTLEKDSGAKIKLSQKTLERKRETQAQRSVSGFERFDNLKEAFELSAGAKDSVKGKKIILVDDVYTTGSTASVCAKVLKDAGGKEVHLLAFATGNDFAEGYFLEEQKWIV